MWPLAADYAINYFGNANLTILIEDKYVSIQRIFRKLDKPKIKDEITVER